MKEPRHVVEKKGRYLVAIPAGVREHLGLVGGAQVWWHTTAKREAALTVTGQRGRGRPLADADCPTCSRYREEATRLRAMLRTTTVVDYNTAFNQGVQQGVKLVPVWRAELDQLHDEYREVARLLAQLVVRLPERKAPRRQRGPAPRVRIEDDPPYADDFDSEGRVKPRAPSRDPQPDPSTSSEVLDGGDAASGAAPPGRPQDT